MNLRTLAARNVWRNRGRYMAYLGSTAFSVMIYFLYTSLAHHPQLAGGYRGADYVLMGVRGASIVIAIFTLLFLLYSGAAFVRSRMKEFGLLTLLGLSHAQLVRVIVWENIVVGVSAIGIGMGLGLLFLKLFFMAISFVLRMPAALPVYTAWSVWRQTLLVFGGSFLLVSVLSLRGVLGRNIIELVRAERQPKENPRFSAGKALLGLVLVGGGYAWASVPNPIIVTLGVMPVTAIVAVGTYFVVRELSIAVLAWLHGRRPFFYRPGPFLTVSRLAFKLQDNYRVLSAVAILVAVILSTVGTIFAFYVVAEEDARRRNPQAIQLLLPDGSDMEKEAARVQAVLDAYGVDYLERRMGRLPEGMLGKTRMTLVPYSFYESLYRPEGAPLPLPFPLSDGGSAEAVGVYGFTLFFQGNGEGGPFRASLLSSDGPLELQVVPDHHGQLLNGLGVGLDSLVLEDAAFADWVERNPEARFTPVVVWTGENWRGPGMREALSALRELYAGSGTGSDEPPAAVILSTTLEGYEELIRDFGIALFIGIFVSLVFFAATGSLLYFRLFTELDEDRRYYMRLQQLGLGAGQLRQLAAVQAGVVFFVPFLFGLLHSTFAMRALGTLLMRSVLHFGWMVALAYLVPYGVYFVATFGLYWRTLRVDGAVAGAEVQ